MDREILDFARQFLREDASDLYENAPCAYLSTLPDGTILNANATFLRWTGYDRSLLNGKIRLQDLLPAAGRIYCDTHYRPLLFMQGYVNELAFDILCKDGQRLPVFLSSTMKNDEAGNPVLVRTTLLDARSRRAYEQELLAAKRRAEEAEAALRQLNDTLEEEIAARTAERDRLWHLSQDLLALGSMDGHFLRVNPAFTTVLGWTEAEVTGLPFKELVHPDELDTYAEAMQKLRAGVSLSQLTGRRRHKNGSYRWISWNIIPQGEYLYLSGRDVTEEKRQAAALHRAEESLYQAQKMEAVGQLTGGLAHDFNNLLAGIVGNLQLMRVRLAQGRTEDVSRYIDAAESVADRASALTRRMLTFARRQTLSSAVLNLNQIVVSMSDMFQQIVGPDIQIHFVLADELWQVQTDRNQLESALLNLVINARDAMPDGGRVVIETKNILADSLSGMSDAIFPTTEHYVAVRVKDSGIGMSPEVVSRAFEPFFTTKPIGQGTGLGLSMIFGFVKQAGGHAEIDSSAGKGTTVSLYLPRHTGETEGIDNKQAHTELAKRAVATGTILLVDDEASLRTLLAEVLTDAGYTVIEANTSTDAMMVLNSGRDIDLLVSDIGLRDGLNGRQLVNEAKQLHPMLKTILVTGYVQDTRARSELASSQITLLVKPFELSTFMDEVTKALQSRQ